MRIIRSHGSIGEGPGDTGDCERCQMVASGRAEKWEAGRDRRLHRFAKAEFVTSSPSMIRGWTQVNGRGFYGPDVRAPAASPVSMPQRGGRGGKRVPHYAKGNNGVGNGLDPQAPGNPPIYDGPGTGPGNRGRGK